MQTTAHLVGAFVKLAAGVEHGHDDLKRRLVKLLVLVDGDASAVVLNGDALVFVDGHLYVGAIACHCLVDRVVHGLVHQVMKTLLAYIADIHRRTLAHGFKAFQNLDVTG